MKTITCAQPHCTNSITVADELDDAAIEKVAAINGWTKQPDGSWKGCGNPPESCPLVEQPPKEK